ncbi:MAG: metallophosphoesterase [Terracidiphilus sp.]
MKDKEILVLKAWPVVGIILIQGALLLAHWFIGHTWIAFWWPMSGTVTLALRTMLTVLAFSFVAAALLGFLSAHRLVSLLYWLASIWLGFFNFFFWAACLCWLSLPVLHLAGVQPERPLIAATLFGLAALTAIYGLLNAFWIRVRRIAVELDGLPDSWRGRTALVVSDLHLGHINGSTFSSRVAALGSELNPDIVFFPGDLFDGMMAGAAALAAPLGQLAPPFGMFASTGNHDEFGNTALYADALNSAGIRVLANEKVTVDGLEIVGVNYGDAGYPIRFQATLKSLRPETGRAGILLNHVPARLALAEQAGIGLQLSGHTHGGQIFPFTWFTRRAFGKYTYGLQRFGALQIYTSSGAGSWGPPMRVGTQAEIVLLSFE